MPQAVPPGLRGPAVGALPAAPPPTDDLEALAHTLARLAADVDARAAHRGAPAPPRPGLRLRAQPAGRAEPVLPVFDDDGTTFSWAPPVPPDALLLPTHPPVRTPQPYPTDPALVNEDFASRDWRERERERDAALARMSPAHRDVRAKQSRDSSQVPISTFYNHVDAYFKAVTEDDLAWLSGAPDDPGPFAVPPRGPPYRQVWEREDAELLGAPLPEPSVEAGPPAGAALTLGELVDEHMHNQRAWIGPLVERLAAAVRPERGAAPPAAPPAAAEQAAGPSSTGPPLPPPDVHKNLCDAEAAAGASCTSLGLADSWRWSDAADDAITAALRRAQALLREQMHTNAQRKARLFRVAVERMALQDYQACLHAVEREIEAGWTRRQRQLRAPGKRRRTEPAPLPAALAAALVRRRQLKRALEPLFARLPHAWTPPHESIYL